MTNQLVIYGRDGKPSRAIPMTQDEHDPTKWHLAESIALTDDETELAYICLDGEDPHPLGRRALNAGPPVPINTLFRAGLP